MGQPGDSRRMAMQRTIEGTSSTAIAHSENAMSNALFTKRYPSRPSAGAGTGTGPSASDTSSGARNATSEAAIGSASPTSALDFT